MPPPTNCPKCGGAIVVREGPYGPFDGCSAFPACRYSWSRGGFDGFLRRVQRKARNDISRERRSRRSQKNASPNR